MTPHDLITEDERALVGQFISELGVCQHRVVQMNDEILRALDFWNTLDDAHFCEQIQAFRCAMPGEFRDRVFLGVLDGIISERMRRHALGGCAELLENSSRKALTP